MRRGWYLIVWGLVESLFFKFKIKNLKSENRWINVCDVMHDDA